MRKKAKAAETPDFSPAAYPVLIDEETAAAMLDVAPLTLKKWRLAKMGPAHVRMGKSGGVVRYRLPDVLAYIDAKIVGARKSDPEAV